MLPHAVSVGGGEGPGVVVEARVSYQLKSLIMSEFHSPKKKKKNELNGDFFNFSSGFIPGEFG